MNEDEAQQHGAVWYKNTIQYDGMMSSAAANPPRTVDGGRMLHHRRRFFSLVPESKMISDMGEMRPLCFPSHAEHSC